MSGGAVRTARDALTGRRRGRVPSVATRGRGAGGRARRERQSLGDALYAIYVTALVAFFPLYALFAGRAPAPGAARSAAASVEPLVVLGVALTVLVSRAGAAVRGGPVVLPPEDARLLLTWPLPRRELVLPALVAALSRAGAVAVPVSAMLLYVDVRVLGAPARDVLRDDLLLPLLLSLVVVLVAWLVQVTPSAAVPVRLAGGVVAAAALLALGAGGRRLAVDGVGSTLQAAARWGPRAGSLPMGGAAGQGPPASGLLAVAVLAGLLVPLGVLALRAAGQVTPEQLLARSRRAEVTRTALRLGFTASVYLTRTEPVRRARRWRRALRPTRRPLPALAGKAFLQEQGTPVVPRLVAAAAAAGTALGAAAHVRTGPDLGPTTIWALVAAGALTLVATRFADPVRLDVDAAPCAAAIPLRHAELARVDLGVSAATATVGAVLGLAADALLGVVAPGRLPVLLLGAVAVGLLLAAAGALGALSDDPSPLLPPWAAVGYRTTGFAAVLLACVGAGLVLRAPPSARADQHPDRLATAALLVAFVAMVAAGVAAHRAARALTRGR